MKDAPETAAVTPEAPDGEAGGHAPPVVVPGVPADGAPAPDPRPAAALQVDAEAALDRRDYATARRLFDALGRIDMTQAIDVALSALDRKDYGAAETLFGELASRRRAPAPGQAVAVVVAAEAGAAPPPPPVVPPIDVRTLEPESRRPPPEGGAQTRGARSRFVPIAAGAVLLALAGGALYASTRVGSLDALKAQAIASLFPNAGSRSPAASEPPRAAEPAGADDARAAGGDLRAALADATARLDRIERETGARLDRLAERVGQGGASTPAGTDVAARLEALEKAAAEKAAAPPSEADLSALSARLDRLEKKAGPAAPGSDLAARLDRVEKKLAAVTAAKPVAPGPGKPPPGPGGPPAIANDPGAPPRLLQDFAVEGVQGGVAVVASRFGPQQVAPGDFIPGAGRVLRIERRGGQWVVVTTGGVIVGAPGPF